MWTFEFHCNDGVTVFQCTDDVIGGVMGVLAKRRGNIVEEIHSPDSPLCVIRAHMPVNEGFGEHTFIFYHFGRVFFLRG